MCPIAFPLHFEGAVIFHFQLIIPSAFLPNFIIYVHIPKYLFIVYDIYIYYINIICIHTIYNKLVLGFM